MTPPFFLSIHPYTGSDSLETSLGASNGTEPVNSFTSAGWYNTFEVAVLDLTVAPDNQVILYQAAYEFEASYFLSVAGNVAIAPSVYWSGNSNNFESNPTIYRGTLRMQFSCSPTCRTLR